MNRFLRYWLPLLVWMAVIFSASGDANSVRHSSGLLSKLLGWLHVSLTEAQLEAVRWAVRKGAHLTEYAILACLWWRALRSATPAPGWSTRRALLVVTACFLYASSDEFHQMFVRDRSASFLDVLIDTLGACCALLVIWFVRWRRRQQ